VHTEYRITGQQKHVCNAGRKGGNVISAVAGAAEAEHVLYLPPAEETEEGEPLGNARIEFGLCWSCEVVAVGCRRMLGDSLSGGTKAGFGVLDVPPPDLSHAQGHPAAITKFSKIPPHLLFCKDRATNF